MDYKNCLAFLVCHSAKRKSIDFAKFDVRYTLEPLEFTVPSGSLPPPRKKHRLNGSRRDGDNRAPPTPLKGSPRRGLRAPLARACLFFASLILGRRFTDFPTHKKERAQDLQGLPKSIGELFGKRRNRRKSKHPTGILSDAAKSVVFRRGGDNRAPPTPLKGSPRRGLRAPLARACLFFCVAYPRAEVHRLPDA